MIALRNGVLAAVLLILGGCTHKPFAALCSDPPEDQNLAQNVERACAGDRFAATNLARAYETGNGLPQSHGLARLTYEYAAAAGPGRVVVTGGTPVKCTPQLVRTKYLSGGEIEERLTNQNVCTGDGLRRQFVGGAAPDPRAMYALGRIYWDGIGVEQDQAKAVWWLEEAAKRRHPGAIAKLEAIGRLVQDLRENGDRNDQS